MNSTIIIDNLERAALFIATLVREGIRFTAEVDVSKTTIKIEGY